MRITRIFGCWQCSYRRSCESPHANIAVPKGCLATLRRGGSPPATSPDVMARGCSCPRSGTGCGLFRRCGDRRATGSDRSLHPRFLSGLAPGSRLQRPLLPDQTQGSLSKLTPEILSRDVIDVETNQVLGWRSPVNPGRPTGHLACSSIRRSSTAARSTRSTGCSETASMAATSSAIS